MRIVGGTSQSASAVSHLKPGPPLPRNTLTHTALRPLRSEPQQSVEWPQAFPVHHYEKCRVLLNGAIRLSVIFNPCEQNYF